MGPEQPGRSGLSEQAEASAAVGGDGEPAAPMSMLDAVGRLSPEQAGLLGVLIGLRRLGDEPPETARQG